MRVDIYADRVEKESERWQWISLIKVYFVDCVKHIAITLKGILNIIL